MINYHECFTTYEGAKEFYDKTLKWYPSGGYATSLCLHQDGTQGVWWVYGSRFSSCD